MKNVFNDIMGKLIHEFAENPDTFHDSIRSFRIQVELLEGLAATSKLGVKTTVAAAAAEPKRRGRPPGIKKGKPGRPKKVKA